MVCIPRSHALHVGGYSGARETRHTNLRRCARTAARAPDAYSLHTKGPTMCLDTVTRTYDSPLEGVKTGYKVFLTGEDYPLIPAGTVKNDCRPYLYELGEWYESYIGRGEVAKPHGYKPGFHIFATKRGAKAWGGRVFKVEFSAVTCVGTQDIWFSGRYKCYVANEMRVVGPV